MLPLYGTPQITLSPTVARGSFPSAAVIFSPVFGETATYSVVEPVVTVNASPVVRWT